MNVEYASCTLYNVYYNIYIRLALSVFVCVQR